jgi:hypothetical protein
MMFAASLAFAQAGNLDLTMDGGATCDLNNAAGFMQVNVVHRNSPGATACQYSVNVYGTPLSFVGQTSAYNVIGSGPTTGFAVAYGSCLVSPIDVMTITYMGTSAACDYLAIEDDPGAAVPGIYMTDCTLPNPVLLTIPAGGIGYVNNDGSCGCNIPAEDTSWGQIKALYQ